MQFKKFNKNFQYYNKKATKKLNAKKQRGFTFKIPIIKASTYKSKKYRPKRTKTQDKLGKRTNILLQSNNPVKNIIEFNHNSLFKTYFEPLSVQYKNRKLQPLHDTPEEITLEVSIYNIPCIIVMKSEIYFYLNCKPQEWTKSHWLSVNHTKDYFYINKHNQLHPYITGTKNDPINMQHKKYTEEELFQLSLEVTEPELYSTIYNVIQDIKHLEPKNSVLDTISTINESINNNIYNIPGK